MKKLHRLVSAILSFAFAISMAMSAAPVSGYAAANTANITLNVTYCQTSARSMLSMINALRTGSNAWYWNETSTEKVYAAGLGELTYDCNLEAIAMQRAAEIAISYSHTRPNGENCWSAYDESTIVYTARGENLAAGYTSVEKAFAGLSEESASYSGQGHRRNMLSSSFNAVGIACVYYDGYYYWVQEFGTTTTAAAMTQALDGTVAAQVEICTDDIVTVVYSGSFAELQLTNTWPARAGTRPVSGLSA